MGQAARSGVQGLWVCDDVGGRPRSWVAAGTPGDRTPHSKPTAFYVGQGHPSSGVACVGDVHGGGSPASAPQPPYQQAQLGKRSWQLQP